ncbi:MAG TPA: class I SAM-dependent methyltransferase [Deltaproteobacteria bacterium]|nr:class I SAM-dependent methyltransferase [Deltaproteobacteria bacterium]HPR53084.1 class I SAM-dependent methyltransferase [Deltaproteobacteria bacterium]
MESRQIHEKITHDSPEELDDIVNSIFMPVYPVIARQVLERTRCRGGICIDLGSGPARLTIELARMGRFSLYAVDFSHEINRIARKNIARKNLSGRILPVTADVSNLPFAGNSADLIVSRSSIFFWENLKETFSAMYRIVKPGAKAYLGGGFGTAELKRSITEQMKHRDGWEEKIARRLGRASMENIRQELDNAGIRDYTVIHDDSGLWFCIEKR